MVSTLERRRMRRGLKKSKCCSHFFNIILLIAVLGAVGVSVWIFLTVWEHPGREGALYIVGVFYLVCNILPAALGVVAVLVVFIGTCGLCTTNRCTLLWYFTSLMVVFVLTIGGTVCNFIFYFELRSNIASSLSTSVKEEYGLYGLEEFTRSIDLIQTQFMCCGSLSHEEWRTSEWHRFQGLSHFKESDVPTIPPSCCNMTMSSNGNETQPLDLRKCSHRDSTYPNDYMFNQNCTDALYTWLELSALILAVACAALLITELLAITSCAVLFRLLGPVHYEEKKLLRRMQGNPDWDKHRRFANSRF